MIPSVSVICPIRNEEQYIAQCLESLLQQSYDPDDIEILVVDGMSDDNTREIVRDYMQNYPRIRLIDNPKRIVPCALNIAVTAAQGKYILRMDGHAKAAPDYVENCVKALQNRDIECVGGPIISVNKTDTGKAIALAMSSQFGVGNSRFRTSNEECFVDSLAFPAFKREVFDKCGLFDEELVRCQDDEFNFRLRRFGGKILLTPTVKSWYFPRTDFRRLWRQYFGYGFWKVRVFQKNPLQMQPRHFVPAAFVLTLGLCFLLGMIVPFFMWSFIAITALYSGSALAATIYLRNRNPGISFMKIMRSFFILHFSYGSGFLAGLIRFAPRWLKGQEPDGAGAFVRQT